MGKERLAPAGFYVEYGYHSSAKEPDFPEKIGLTYISEDQKCKYIHADGSRQWNTLLWSCAPTKKSLKRSSERKPVYNYVTILDYFATHEELLDSRYAKLIKDKYSAALICP